MKRCKYCGSTLIHPDTRHKTFSTGKAVAGAVTFGVVGAAAGFIGKDKNGYSCGACGAFMDAPMEFSTELGIDSAIRDARAGRNYSTYEYFKSQYPNIENVPAPVQAQIPQAQPAALLSLAPVPALPAAPEAAGPAVKNRYRYLLWQPDCPVYVEEVIVKAGPQGDLLSLVACNQSSQPIRSAYFNVVCYDDTGDVASTVTCVYQGLSIEPGAALPAEKEFSLNTEVAYRIDLVCDKVALTDGSVWRNSEDSPKITLPVQEELTSENFPRFRYLRSELSDVCRTVPERLYFPAESEDVRLCICGHPTLPGTPCRFCGIGEDALRDLLSQKRLAELQQKSVKEIAERRAAKSIPLYAAAADEA
ncbi:MAG: hypothetical protein IJU99_05485, partial [Lachnospiraceae bacterium]|nr:hypothetical protein [Lachnospiraceae bacterium]